MSSIVLKFLNFWIGHGLCRFGPCLCWTCLFGSVYWDLYLWTRLFGLVCFGSVYLDPFFKPVYLDLSAWTRLFKPVHLDPNIWTSLFGGLLGPVYLDPYIWTSLIDPFIWTNHFGLVSADRSILIRIIGTVFLNPSIWTRSRVLVSPVCGIFRCMLSRAVGKIYVELTVFCFNGVQAEA